MLVVVVSRDDRFRHRVHDLLAGIHVVPTPALSLVDIDPEMIDCVVVSDDDVTRTTHSYSDQLSRIPVVRMRNDGPTGLRIARGTPVYAYSAEGTSEHLRVVVTQASTAMFFRRLSECWANEGRLAPSLRLALQLASEVESRVTTVKELANSVRRSPRTMEHHWQQFVNGASRVRERLQTVVWWLLILRTVAKRNAGTNWRDVPRLIGVHPHTLARVAVRVTGASMTRLRFMSGDDVVERFVKYSASLGVDEHRLTRLIGNCGMRGSVPYATIRNAALAGMRASGYRAGG